ncbi:hypothetical protein SEA_SHEDLOCKHOLMES_74 [Mycobacterium phage ShedlockHolmes]|uniref:DUF7183 domain-containing protein n=1 Tax=Mycobacterium phage ShedlockHolmes TaxID=1647313 RepID=A0A0F6YRN3_9CAUD|nr:hypothetical protein SEA_SHEDLOCKHOLMES_74 [Mycobacterium phage ShedlockHolmes]AKF15251.1 hypothetical protein SEA_SHEDLOCKHOLMES_74 [Mycobacterium phage ShedlockHolmes]
MPELIELSVDEVQVLADTVRSRIVHPSHTPVQAIRAGLAAVNAMRLKAAEVTGELAADAPVVIVAAPVHRPRPRKVSTLGVRERSSEWLDVDGDRWRWCFMRNLWQYRPCDPQPWEHSDDVEGWIDCPTGSDGSPSPRYAPFTEVSRA